LEEYKYGYPSTDKYRMNIGRIGEEKWKDERKRRLLLGREEQIRREGEG
jgi:hypothetical protein